MSIVYEMLVSMLSYYALFQLLALLSVIIMGIFIYSSIMAKIKQNKEEAAFAYKDDASLKNENLDELSQDEKNSVIRQILAPDGVDPNPLAYFVVNDAGKDIYIRTFTLDKLPKRVTFASTFSELMNFGNCTASVFIEPVAETTIQRKMDRHLISLESEFIGANKKDDTNRKRKLQGQYADTNAWAEKVDAGEVRFYEVGFVFSLRANSLEELNKASDSFRAIALEKAMEISSCYGLQSEAYLSNAPLNERFSLTFGAKKLDGIKMHLMDQRALSTIFNHTQTDFSHKNGIPIGRNLITGKPITFDIYDGSHDGYTMLICGKTGSGKSATIKIMCSRYWPFGYRFVAVDSQPINAVGEYAGLAELMGGVNFQIKAGTDVVMNIFEVSESKKFITKGTEGREVLTLELREKIAQVVNTILTMVQGSRRIDDSKDMTFIEGIITDTVKELYADFGIVDGHPETLYLESTQTSGNGMLAAGREKKPLPVITDFFKLLLKGQKSNKRENRNDLYDLIITAMKDYVKELYYSVDTLTFFTREEYEALPVGEDGRKYYVNPETGKNEFVEFIYGIRSYFDGQSTVAISKECPFTNFDISQLPESEKILARQIAIDFVNEQFIKKNSENAKTAASMVAIFDEAHENFALDYARKTIDNVVRTARKRHVSIWLSTQALKEYDNYPETQSILRNAAVKMVCKQDYQDRKYLMEALNLTASQVEMILNLGGDVSDKEGKNARRGETCIIDNNKVAFCKVDYLKRVEAYAVETDLTEVRKLYSRSA